MRFEGCEGETPVADACYRYSGIMLSGFKDVVEKNMKEAFEYAKKYVNSIPWDFCSF